jgi:hypothetical protein
VVFGHLFTGLELKAAKKMSKTPLLILTLRKMKMHHCIPLWVLTLCCAASLSTQSYAQTSALNRYPLTPEESYKAKTAPREREFTSTAQTQRAAAISIIKSLVDESDRYQNQTLKVRTQARAADAIWDVDSKFAKELFLRAWETAEKEDEKGVQAAEDARKKFLTSRDGSGSTLFIPPATNLRSEVLKLAAQRDPELGESLLERLDDAKERDEAAESKNSAPSFFDPTDPKLVIVKRLELALQLLEAGDVKQAKAFAAPALEYATSQGIIFLCELRQRDAAAADEQYAKLLARTVLDAAADATTVSLLSTYAFTPGLLVTATRTGRTANQFADTARTYDLSPELRAKFFNVAANILLRQPPPLDRDQTSAGRAGTYFTIARLLPIFEQYNSDYVPALKAQLTLLSPDTPATFRSGEESMLRMGLVREGNTEGLADILNQLDGVVNSPDRDAVYVKAIRAAATSGDPRVREFAEKIENSDLKGQARSFTDFTVVRNAISKKDIDAGLRIVRDGYLTPLHRVWALAQFASLLKKSDPPRAIQLLNEALTEAKRINLGEPERAYALICVALSLFEIDRLHSLDIVSDVIKAANAVTKFSGEDGKLSARLRVRNIVAMVELNEPLFNAVNLFALLARKDLQLAIELANTLSGETPRSAANLAIARSILTRQKPSTPPARK